MLNAKIEKSNRKFITFRGRSERFNEPAWIYFKRLSAEQAKEFAQRKNLIKLQQESSKMVWIEVP